MAFNRIFDDLDRSVMHELTDRRQWVSKEKPVAEPVKPPLPKGEKPPFQRSFLSGLYEPFVPTTTAGKIAQPLVRVGQIEYKAADDVVEALKHVATDAGIGSITYAALASLAAFGTPITAPIQASLEPALGEKRAETVTGVVGMMLPFLGTSATIRMGMSQGTKAALGILKSPVATASGKVSAIKQLAPKPSNRARISEELYAWDALKNVSKYDAEVMSRKIAKLVPDKERQKQVIFALERSKNAGPIPIALSNAERSAADLARKYFDDLHKAEVEAGVAETALENYVTHIFRLNDPVTGNLLTKNGSILTQIMDAIKGVKSEPTAPKGISPKLVYAKERSIRLPLEDILQHPALKGLNPIMELDKIVYLRGQASARAIANKQLLDSIKARTDPQGNPLLFYTAQGKPPAGYRFHEHRQLSGYAIHPNIYPSLQHVFERPMNEATRGILAINYAVKRSKVSFSGFHAKTLLDAEIGAGGNPARISETLRNYWDGQLGEPFRKLLKSGLVIGTPEDIRREPFYQTMEALAKVADKYTGKVGGIPFDVYTKTMKVLDKVTWDYLQTGFKVQIAMKTYEKLLLTYPAEHPDVLARATAEYTNNLFGGLNWMRLAESARTDFGYRVFSFLYSPEGRRLMQGVLFAPDWTFATTKSMISAIPGVAKNKYVRELHQAYIGRSAVYYLTIANALNYFYTGHSILQNEDPTFVDFGDGRRMQFSKHAIEPLHYILYRGHPAMEALTKQVSSKLAFVPSELIEQFQNQQYLGPEARKIPPIYKKGESQALKRAEHLGKQFLPFVGAQGLAAAPGETSESMIAGFLGMPIYGTSYAEQRRRKEKIKERRHLKKPKW